MSNVNAARANHYTGQINALLREMGGKPLKGLEQLPLATLKRMAAELQRMESSFDTLRRVGPDAIANRLERQAVVAFRQAAREASVQATANRPISGQSTGGQVPGSYHPANQNTVAQHDPGRDAWDTGNGGGMYFEDRVMMLMIKVVEEEQKKIEKRLQALDEAAKAAEGNKDDKKSESRNIEFEKIKMDMQKLSQMQQAMSNVLNTQDELAKNAIRNIKG